MKRTLLLISCFYSLANFAQNINNGIYFNVKRDRAFESDVFEFKDKNRFNYVLFTCTGTGIGSGTYELIKDSIYFKFTEMPKSINATNLTFVKSDSDSLTVNLKIVEYDTGYELPGANCTLVEERINWSADINGNVNKKFAGNASTRTLNVDFIGYESTEIEIPEDVTEVNGIVRLGNIWLYNSTEKLNLEILSMRKSNFMLARYEGKNITYEKIKKSKISKMIEERTGKSYDYFVETK